MTGWTEACMIRNELDEQVTAHTHYRNVCHAYPGPDGEVMVAGQALSPPLVQWLHRGQPKQSTLDPADRPPPPCPSCGTPVDIEWLEVTACGDPKRTWLPGEMTCPRNKRHDARAASVELSWPAELTDDDRAWLRKQVQLAKEAS